MKLSILLLLAFALFGQSSEAPLTVSGEAEVKVVPDQVIISLGVEARDPSLAAAKLKNDRGVRSVLAAIERLKVDPADVQTDFINVNLHYDRANEYVVDYYAVEKSIAVTLRDISRFEALLSAVLDAGANHIYGVDFRHTQLRRYRDQARALAVKAAMEKASDLAAAAGLKAGKPISISTYSYGSWYGRGRAMLQNVSQNISQAGGGEPPEGTIALGKISVSATVTMTFRLE